MPLSMEVFVFLYLLLSIFMLKQLFGNSGWFEKLIQLTVVCFLFLMAGFILWTAVFGNSQTITSLKAMQLVNSVFVFILPVVFLSRYWYEKPLSSYSLDKTPDVRQIVLVAALVIFIQPFINLTAYFNEQIHFPPALKSLEDIFVKYESQAEKVTSQFLAVKSAGGYLFNLFLIALLPAFGEELFFRGGVQNIFSEKFSKHAAIWITAAVFSLVHFQMFGFIPRMLLGAAFGYLLVWTRTLWIPVLAHFLNNAIGVTAGFLKPEYASSVKAVDNLGKGDTILFGIISGVLSAFILWLIFNISKTSSKE